jgi:Bacterial Ig-like domain
VTGSMIPEDGDLVVDPALRTLLRALGRQPAEPRIRPDFRDRLRAELVAARSAAIAARDSTPSGPGPAFGGALGGPGHPSAPRRRIWVAGLVAAAVAIGTVAGVAARGQRRVDAVRVSVTSRMAGALAVDPRALIVVRFSRPVDQAATAAALRVSPATLVRTSWEGDTLTVRAVHGFAPNTPYRVRFDGRVARTLTRAPFAGETGLTFGTTGISDPSTTAPPPGRLVRRSVAAVRAGSLASFIGEDSLLLTGALAEATTSFREGLVRLGSDRTSTSRTSTPRTVPLGPVILDPATAAICVSRSGRSVTYLASGTAGTEVVFADSNGDRPVRTAVRVDPGSPLGWIGDAEVGFVGAGRLRAVDRTGRVRVLSSVPVDLARGAMIMAPGGRYVFLRSGPGGPGRIINLSAGRSHVLTGLVGTAAFSPDGGTVVWVAERRGRLRLAIAPSAGGPTLTGALPVTDGDRLSDLAVAPGGGRLAYTVTDRAGDRELRVAALPDGHTLATSGAGGGAAPSWSPSGAGLSVRVDGPGGSRIERVRLPASVGAGTADASAVAASFARAQLGGDGDAQRALATPGLPPPPPVRATRYSVLWAARSNDGTATARVRLTADPGPGPGRITDETLTLTPADGGRAPAVTSVAVAAATDAPSGPALIGTDSSDGATVALTFDSDLDPAAVPSAITVRSASGTTMGRVTSYDAATRTVTVRPRGPGPLVVIVSGRLRDVAGRPPHEEIRVPVGPPPPDR